MLFGPVVFPDHLEGVLGPILFTAVLLSALLSVASTRRRAVVATALAIPGCGLIIAAFLRPGPVLLTLSTMTVIVFLVVASAFILEYVFKAHQVDGSVILGSLCVFMLAAAIWGELYALMEFLDPGSFHLQAPETRGAMRGQLRYFSIVTITTVGFGDIYPLSPLARATTATEAILGQLYLVVLVARLVGLQTAQEAAERSERPSREGTR
jgi:hypothetical protein